MKITIYGVGYVGLVTGAGLANIGHDVMCIDVDEEKIASLKAGAIPIFEPGLDAVVARVVAAGRLRFSSDTSAGVSFADVQMLAVGTPADETGAPDLRHLWTAVRTIGENMQTAKVIVTKSTVPVGTASEVEELVRETLSTRAMPLEIEAIANPEFLREGSAVVDFMKPDRIIIGARTPRGANLMKALYAPLALPPKAVIVMDPCSAELTKYAANAMLATRIGFINEIANLAERLGADIECVKQGIGSDPRIGPHFINPGIGFGGSCFPKDIQGLQHMANQENVELGLIDAVAQGNQTQRHVLFDKMVHHFGGASNLKGKGFAVWGLAYKANTDDIRMSPAIDVIELLLQAGASVRAFDPAANERARGWFGGAPNLTVVDSMEACLSDADALVICTEWEEFQRADFETLHENLVESVIFDGRNIFDPQTMDSNGFTYYGIGRSTAGRDVVLARASRAAEPPAEVSVELPATSELKRTDSGFDTVLGAT